MGFVGAHPVHQRCSFDWVAGRASASPPHLTVMHGVPVWAQQMAAGQGDQEPSEESALAAMQIDKVSARQLLAQSLPVPSDVLAANQKALAAIGAKARQARAQVGPPSPSCIPHSCKCMVCSRRARLAPSVVVIALLTGGMRACARFDFRQCSEVVWQSVPFAADPVAWFGARAHAQEEQRAIMAARVRTEPHPSYAAVIAAMLAASNGAYRTPLELADIAEAAASAQVRCWGWSYSSVLNVSVLTGTAERPMAHIGHGEAGATLV